MDAKQEIANKVGNLPPESPTRVPHFVASLDESDPVGEKGANLCQFASSLDSLSARQMILAIEDECERVQTT